MTTTTPTGVDAIVHQIAQLATQLDQQVHQPNGHVDPKYVVTAEFVEAPSAKVQPLLKEWRKAKKALDAKKAELEDVERKIKDLMNGAEVLVVEETQQHVVESRVTTGQVFDTTRFKKEQPVLAGQYQRTRYSRNFRVLV
jgi:hypothetical protein